MAEIGAYSPETARMVLEVVKYLKASGFVLASGQKPPIAPDIRTPIYVRNDSGSTIPPYGCMQAIGTVEYGGQNLLTVDIPADTTGDAGPFLFNSHHEIPDGEMGIATNDVCVRAISADTDAGTLLAPTTSDFELEESSTGGFICVGSDDIAIDTVRIVRAGGGGGGLVAKTPSGGIPAISGTTPGSATCDRWEINAAGTFVDTTENVTIYNVFSSSIAGATYITAKSVAGKWIVDAEDCDAGTGPTTP